MVTVEPDKHLPYDQRITKSCKHRSFFLVLNFTSMNLLMDNNICFFFNELFLSCFALTIHMFVSYISLNHALRCSGNWHMNLVFFRCCCLWEFQVDCFVFYDVLFTPFLQSCLIVGKRFDKFLISLCNQLSVFSSNSIK